ncbi:hypothetical protein [Klebsiella pneumoniae]|uniref:hypothetical protein n=1 Tax=Klebsiella pneumoniae TaxID=573 RepID=UPI003985CE03
MGFFRYGIELILMHFKELFARHGRNKLLTEQGIQLLGYSPAKFSVLTMKPVCR